MENIVMSDISVAKRFVIFMKFAVVLYIKLLRKHEFCENKLSDTLATYFSRIGSKEGCSCIFVRNNKTFSSIEVFQFGLENNFGALYHKN